MSQPAEPDRAVDDACWVVIAGGHGSIEVPNYPIRLQTRAAAQAEGDRWVNYADTIGGTASVVPVEMAIAALQEAREIRRRNELIRLLEYLQRGKSDV